MYKEKNIKLILHTSGSTLLLHHIFKNNIYTYMYISFYALRTKIIFHYI
jgi:hypothetical protein